MCGLKCESHGDGIKEEEILHHKLSMHSEVMCGVCHAASHSYIFTLQYITKNMPLLAVC
jgi:hypothetical protein